MHRVAGEGGRALRDDGLQELEDARFDVGLGEVGGAHLVDQPRFPVRGLVPRVHGVEHLVGLVEHVDRSLGDRVEVGVGDHHGDLENAVALGNEARHLHVYPNQRGLVRSHVPIVSQPAQ